MAKARSLNKVTLIGNLTRNPVIKSTANGFTVCTFGIATNSSWRDGDGNIKERAEFHNIVAWNKLAEVCAQILGVGMLVYLEGELRTRVWADASGNKQYRTEIKLDDMILLDSKDKDPVGLDKAKDLGSESTEDIAEEENSMPEVPAQEMTSDMDDEDLF